jgi:mono/diheme cytochrome c family protein
MKSKITSALLVIVPICFISIFLYMAYGNAAYDHPGQSVYETRCANCHGNHGEGIQALVPPLLNADLALNNMESIPCWIKKGMNQPITVNGKPYNQSMYPIELNEVEVANLMNYLTREMLPTHKTYNSDSISMLWRSCK